MPFPEVERARRGERVMLEKYGQEMKEIAADWRGLSPMQRSLKLAMWGGGMVAWFVYLGLGYKEHLPPPSEELIYAWLGLGALGGLMLMFGLQGARSPRTPFGVLRGLLVGGVFAVLLAKDIYPEVGPVAVFFIKGGYVAMIAACAVRVFASLRGLPDDARYPVDRQIAEDRVEWRSDRRGRF